MKAFLLGALLLLTAACGAYQFPAAPTPQTGSVSGHITLIGCGGAEPAAGTCASSLAAGLEIDFVDGKVVHSTVTDQKGSYSIQLMPATYQVQFKSHMRIVKGPSSVTVTANSNVVADYVLDSGIRRLPAPQPAPQQGSG